MDSHDQPSLLESEARQGGDTCALDTWHMVFLFVCFFLSFGDRVSCSPGWSQFHCVAKEDCKLLTLLLLSPSAVITGMRPPITNLMYV